MLNSTKTWQEELDKAEKLLEESLRHNPSQTSFYEGYIKGLKFISDLRKKDEEELIKIVKDFFMGDGDPSLDKLIEEYYAK